MDNALRIMRETRVISEVERKRVQNNTRNNRPNQAKFRKAVIDACERCIITDASMPEILEAAHIKPFKYHGEDTIANGFAMRVDIHTFQGTHQKRGKTDRCLYQGRTEPD